MSQVGRRVMEERAARGWSLPELSRRSGVGMDTISHLERGHTSPQPRTVYKLASAFGLTMGELLEGKARALA